MDRLGIDELLCKIYKLPEEAIDKGDFRDIRTKFESKL